MLTDTAGQEEYRGLWAASNLQSDAFLLVYDITSANSLEALDYFMDMIDMEEDNRIDNGKVPPIKIVAGNKCDLQGQRQISARDGLEYARLRKCGFMETSAREMVNIEETFARKSTLPIQRKLRTSRMVSLTGNSACTPRSRSQETRSRRRPRAANDCSTNAERGQLQHVQLARERPRRAQRELLEKAEMLVIRFVETCLTRHSIIPGQLSALGFRAPRL